MALIIKAPTKAPEVPLPELVQASYTQLFQAAENLNIASDELTSAVVLLEAALSHLNLGISGWTRLAGGEDEHTGSWWHRSVGYTKVGEKWRIALKTEGGLNSFPDGDSEEIWAFSDAPRWLRAEGAAKLPQLFKDLAEVAEKTTNLLRARTSTVDEVNSVVIAEQKRLRSVKAAK
jgi:hypothetical protein